MTVERQSVCLHSGRDPGTKYCPPAEVTPELIERLARRSSQILIKKLARNDRQWALWNEQKGRWESNQAGPLLPAIARTSGFFPQGKSDKLHPKVYTSPVKVKWPATGRVYHSNFKWFSGKGEAENHLTINPRSEFNRIAPASFLILFKRKGSAREYFALTVDAADEDLTAYVHEVFRIDESFHCALRRPEDLDFRQDTTGLEQFIAELLAKVRAGPGHLDAFLRSLSRRKPEQLARTAVSNWRKASGEKELHPYRLDKPGDVLLALTRTYEFALYQADERRAFGARLVAALARRRSLNEEGIVRTLVQEFESVYAIFLQAKQARSSRAGGSFEIHMAHMLQTGKVPYAPQTIFSGSRPDFVLPGRTTYVTPSTRKTHSLILSLKTTLRERWRIVVSENAGCPVYLGTLDESVTAQTLDNLERHNIQLVIPESHKDSEYTEYHDRAGVITFHQFFSELLGRRASWKALGLACFDE